MADSEDSPEQRITLKHSMLSASIPRWPIVAVIALLLLGAAAILTVTQMAARSQDRLAATESQATLTAALSTRQHEVAGLARDYSFWNDAVENLVGVPSTEWADANIGEYLSTSFNIAAAFVVDPQGKPTIAYVEGQLRPPPQVAPILSQLPLLVEAARSAAANDAWTGETGPDPAYGFVMWQGMPAIAAVGALARQDGKPGPQWDHQLVLVRVIGQDLLDEIGRDYGFEELHWQEGAVPPSATAVPIKAPDDTALGFFSWKPETPGQTLLKQMLPVIVAAFLVMAALSGGVIHFLERNRATMLRHRALIEEQNLALQQQKERAEQLSRAKSDFLSIISHELRTPLNAIIGFADLIRSEVRGPIIPVYRDYATDIRNSGQQLLGLISDILDLSRIEAGKLTLHEERVDLSKMAEACVNLLRPQFDQKRLTVTVGNLDGLGCVLADERLVRQMLLNLLSNAVKFTPERGRITVEGGRATDGGIEICVADTGIGMTETELKLALEPFVQIESSLARRVEGSGLGLSITKRFIELHGGRMTLESRKDVGTKVTLWFPPAREREADRMVS
jgi:signal transduction histidine kinase